MLTQQILDLVIKSKNKIIEYAYEDFLNFFDKKDRTDIKLIEEIEHQIYVAQCDYDQWGKDADISIQCINSAKKFISNVKLVFAQKKKIGRGGKRVGAGRPIGTTKPNKKKMYSFRLSEEELQEVRKILNKLRGK